MNIKKELLKEHSKKNCDAIVRYIGTNKDRFKELMTCFFDGEYRLTQRAAWPMGYCAQKHPELIRPWLKKLLAFIKKPGQHPAVARNTIRLMQHMEIPEKYQGVVMNTCFDFIVSESAPAAIKAFSLSTLHQLSKKYPDILPELQLIIHTRWEYETPAFKSRAKKILQSPASGKR